MLRFVITKTLRLSILSPNVPVAFGIIVICFPLRLQHSHASAGNGIVVNALSNCYAPSFSYGAYLNQFEMSRQGQQWKTSVTAPTGAQAGYHAINHAPWSMVHDSFRPNRAIFSQLAVSATGQSTILLEFSYELRRYSRLPSPYQYV